ncbi:MAG: polysaccharide biosynthesis/export family protein [Pseudomonadota bacterium]
MVLRWFAAILFAAMVILPLEGVAVAQSQAEAYQLGAGDRLRIVVFDEEDLSGEFELDSTGNFSMPLIGTVDGLGLSPRQLEERITTRLLDGYLRSPRVSIEVLNYRPFFILGEVNNPGQYPYQSGMTVLNAAAMAGGFTFRADEDDIEVQRGESDAFEALPSTSIQPGDIIRVKERLF